MNLLAAKNYDPAGAVSKATSALLAMTAFDTTNLRLAVTVPAHGMVRFHLRCMLEGATTFPQILLGVLNGATVVGRQAPLGAPDGTALATTFCVQDAEFTATGLTPGAANFDAAYGVETIVAATNIKYGGPNNTTANDAFGGFCFEAWDPQPQTANSTLAVDAAGRVDLGKWIGVVPAALTATGKFIQAAVLRWLTDDAAGTPNALATNRVDASVGAMAANVLTAAAINADAITAAKVADGTIDAATFAAGAINAAAIAADAIGASELATDAVNEIRDAVWAAVTRELTSGVNIALAKGVGVTGFNDLDAAGVRGAVGLAAANLDTQLITIAGYIDTEVAAILAAVDTEVAAIKAKTDNLPVDPADASDIAARFTTVDTALAVATKILRNKTLTDPGTGVMTVYDDDNVTPLFMCNIFEDVAGVQVYRGQGADRRDRLA